MLIDKTIYFYNVEFAVYGFLPFNVSVERTALSGHSLQYENNPPIIIDHYLACTGQVSAFNYESNSIDMRCQYS